MLADRIQVVPDAVQAKIGSLDLAVGDLIDGKYRIEELVGVGGMSFVLRALHVDLDETVALKCLNPRWLDSAAVADRFGREARSAVKIKNDHVARVFDVGKLPGGIPYMVMELLLGEDIGKILDRQEQLDVRECAGFMIEACEGLAEAHALGIVHRDVKPENLFIVRRFDGRGQIKLLDFGISKQLLARAGHAPSLDQTQDLLGTPLYMSPEQVRVRVTLDHRTDIWSLGAVFYEMLTGQPPFNGSTVTEVCASILETEPAPPSSLSVTVPEELSRIVLRCLEKDAGLRYPSTAELALELLPFAHPTYHGQADRILRRLRAAGLTELSPASLPPAAPVRNSSLMIPDDPTLLDGSDLVPVSPRFETVHDSSRMTTNGAAATAKAAASKLRPTPLAVLLVLVGAMVAFTVMRFSAAGSGASRASEPSAPSVAARVPSERGPVAEVPERDALAAVAPPAPSARAGEPARPSEPSPKPVASAVASARKPARARPASEPNPRAPAPEPAAQKSPPPSVPRLDIELSR